MEETDDAMVSFAAQCGLVKFACELNRGSGLSASFSARTGACPFQYIPIFSPERIKIMSNLRTQLIACCSLLAVAG